jgi:hypothetical protein
MSFMPAAVIVVDNKMESAGLIMDDASGLGGGLHPLRRC